MSSAYTRHRVVRSTANPCGSATPRAASCRARAAMSLRRTSRRARAARSTAKTPTWVMPSKADGPRRDHASRRGTARTPLRRPIMNIWIKRLFVASVLMNCAAHVQAVETEVNDMDDLLRAKVVKFKAKQTSTQQGGTNASSAAAQTEAGGCGGVDIGNSVGAKPDNEHKEIVVVITGDVIN